MKPYGRSSPLPAFVNWPPLTAVPIGSADNTAAGPVAQLPPFIGDTTLWSQDVFTAPIVSNTRSWTGLFSSPLLFPATVFCLDQNHASNYTFHELNPLVMEAGPRNIYPDYGSPLSIDIVVQNTEDAFAPQPPPSVPEGPSIPLTHAYRCLPCTDQNIVDKHFVVLKVGGGRRYKCIWPDCAKEPFTRKESTRLHVHKHLGTTKLFECILCEKKFSSQGTAQRHRDSQSKTFSCDYCLSEFARKDYRNMHQRRCKQWDE